MSSPPAPLPNHYAVLGIAPTASDDDVRKAYRELSKRHHPDRGGDADRFAQITASYNVLSDKAARDFYDVELRLAQIRVAQEFERTVGTHVPSQDWASVVFSDTPPRPEPPNITRATHYADPLGQRATKAQYIRHRLVSFSFAAAIGASWWPLQYALAKIHPVGSGLLHDVQRVVTQSAAPTLIVVFAVLGAYCEHRFAPIHALRTSYDALRRFELAVLVGIVLGLNAYLALPLFDGLAVAVAALSALLYWLAKRPRVSTRIPRPRPR